MIQNNRKVSSGKCLCLRNELIITKYIYIVRGKINLLSYYFKIYIPPYAEFGPNDHRALHADYIGGTR